MAAERLLGTVRADVAAGVPDAAMIELDDTADKQSMRTMNLGAGAIAERSAQLTTSLEALEGVDDVSVIRSCTHGISAM